MKTILFLILTSAFTLFMGCSDAPTSTTENNEDNLPNISGYPVVSTNQTATYNNTDVISAPAATEAFYGQDAHFAIG